jgi:hypothetical protein
MLEVMFQQLLLFENDLMLEVPANFGDEVELVGAKTALVGSDDHIDMQCWH